MSANESLTAAERWYVRLKAPDCTSIERAEFQQWRALPEHAAAYAATERLWRSVGKLAGRRDLEHLSQQILHDTEPRLEASAPPRWGIAVAATVAGLIALVGGGAFLGSRDRETPKMVYSTRPGERSTIQLADGSQLILNYATELDVRLGKDARSLTLHKGEALFTVAHDATRPFKVDAGDGQVTALGTRFEVRSEAEHVTITLLEGSVAVDRPAEQLHLRLEPGEQVAFTPSTRELSRRTVDPDVVSSWTTGRLRFRSTPLREVLEDVNRYSTTQIRLDDPTLGSIPISGTFKVGDSASIVASLEAVLPIQTTQKDEDILLKRRD